MKRVTLLFIAASLASAQITVKFTPEPTSVIKANVAGVRGLTRYAVRISNGCTNPETIGGFGTLDTAAATIPFLDISEANQVLQGAAQRSFWGTLTRYTQPSLSTEGAAIGNYVAKGNPKVTAILTAASVVISLVQTLAKTQVPSIAPLENQLPYPLILPPGASALDYQFATKNKKGAPPLVTVQLACR